MEVCFHQAHNIRLCCVVTSNCAGMDLRKCIVKRPAEAEFLPNWRVEAIQDSELELLMSFSRSPTLSISSSARTHTLLWLRREMRSCRIVPRLPLHKLRSKD